MNILPEFFFRVPRRNYYTTTYERLENKRRFKRKMWDVLESFGYGIAGGITFGAVIGLYYAWFEIILM